jgi:hypothetical protein
MGIGTSIFLIAAGAILHFALKKNLVAGVDLGTVGIILMVVGVIGLIASLIWAAMARRRRRDVVVDRRY